MTIPSAGVVAKGAACVLAIALSLYGWTPWLGPRADQGPRDLDEAVERHLAIIARAPRPVGSPHHELVEKYLVDASRAAGAEVSAVTRLVARPLGAGPVVAGSVTNVVAVMRGRSRGRALLVVGHYDTVPNGAGASDDGVAVAAMLATMEHLHGRSPLRHDVVFLFSDAEEVGRLGAAAFAQDRAGATDLSTIAAVLNFEARGTGGFPLLFETGTASGGLVSTFARAASRPLATSAAAELYRLLPNDTDFTVFRELGLPGLNFASIDGYAGYHTALDRIDHLEPTSLRERSHQILQLTTTFGEADLTSARGEVLEYFTLFGRFLVRYPLGWSLALGIGALAVVAIALVRASAQRSVRPWRALAFAPILLLLMAAAGALAQLLWRALRPMADGRPLPQNGGYCAEPYFAAFILVTLVGFMAASSRSRHKIRPPEVVLGAAIVSALLAIATALTAPGASYVFAIPAAAAGVSVLAAEPGRHRAWTSSVAWALAMVTVVATVAPLIYLLACALGPQGIPVVCAITVWVAALVMTPETSARGPSAAPAWLLLGLSFALILVGRISNRFDETCPRPDSLLSLANTTEGRAVWASPDAELDAFTGAVLGGQARREAIQGFLPEARRPAWVSTVARRPEPWLEVAATEQAGRGSGRRVTVAVRPLRRSDVIDLRLEPRARATAVRLGGQDLQLPPRSGGTWLQLRGVGVEPFTLTVETNEHEPLGLSAVVRAFGDSDAAAPWPQRPAGFVALPSGFDAVDFTAVRSDFSL